MQKCEGLNTKYWKVEPVQILIPLKHSQETKPSYYIRTIFVIGVVNENIKVPIVILFSHMSTILIAMKLTVISRHDGFPMLE